MKTLLDHAKQQLRCLAQACNFSPADIEHAIDVCQVLGASWGNRNLLDTPRWSSLTDDCSPIEFSISLGDSRPPELRMVSEAQDDPASPEKYWEAGMRLCEELSKRYSACLKRLEQVADLFRPSDQVYYSMLHGVVLGPEATPSFKVYLNPKAKGGNRTRDVLNAAFEKLGLVDAWLQVVSAMREQDELQALCLDLESGNQGRSKLYVRHWLCTPNDLERASAVATENVPCDASRFSRAIWGPISVLPRPPLTMYTLAVGRSAPIHAAVQVPTFPHGGSDAAMRDRVTCLLTRCGLPIDVYRRCLDALATGPLETEIGIHNYISFQRLNGTPRVTVYLCPRMYLYRLGAIGLDPKVAWPSPLN